ncbi:oligosaccharide flippase family protein [Azospirillum soli]|uniref:oligosaccharide flippase family protein n=1 Tax=Azospirillum soli TaxID=1304799 RepID=UPI001AE1FF1E|nr:oligosaccharide flippase family protein [Azospirillum soli]MBP2316398.1 O-antigen/teichoic acid export membrane protein [Azospirillum soli]
MARPMTLAGKTIQGVRVTLTATALAAVLQAGAIAVLARLISPAEYGVVIAALVVLRPVTDVLGAGIEKSVVLPADMPDPSIAARYQTAFVGGVLLTLLLAALALAAAPLAGDIAAALALLAPVTILMAVSAVARGLLRRRLRFASLAAIDVAGLAANGALAVATAVSGWGSHALVAGQWAQSLVQLALGLWLCGHRPSLGIVPTARVLSPIGEGLSKSSVLELLSGQLPQALIGGVLGTAPLGWFNRVYVLVFLPVELIVNAVTRVALTGFSQSRDDRARLRRGGMALIETTGAAVLPICAGMALAGPELVAVALGPQWAEAAALTPWLCVAGAATVLAHTLAMVAEAALRLETRVRIQAAALLLRGAMLAAALPFGLTAAVAAVAASALVSMLLHLGLVVSALALPAGRALALLMPGLTAGAACLACVALVHAMLPPNLEPAWLLAADVAGCGAVTLAVYRVLFPNLLDKLLGYTGFISKRA